jgi:hypothetical protein
MKDASVPGLLSLAKEFGKTMKTLFSKSIRFLPMLGLAAWAVVPPAAAQTPAGLGIQAYAGLTITGAVGGAKVGRSSPRPLHDQELPLEEQVLREHGSGPTTPEESDQPGQ